MGTIDGAQNILAGLKGAGIDLVASVPDINMLQLLNLLYEDQDIAHVPVGREEEGIGVCAGAHLAGKTPAMLMQNGGLLNSANGLTTTALQFGIPVLLLIYYAGDLGDSAFHMVGLVTEPVLQGLGIKYVIMRDPAKVKQEIAGAVTLASASKRPVVLLLTRAVLYPRPAMKRFACLQAIAPLITDELFVTTAGGATNEWNAVRPSDSNIQVKTLGLCSSIGLGLAIGLPKRKVFVFDGDGALWMNLGSLATIGLHQPKNLIHICWDNKQYESSGGEPTVATAGKIDFAGIALNAGIKSSRTANSVDEVKDAVAHALHNDGPHF